MMRVDFLKLFVCAAAGLAGAGLSAPASAQASRTWVSGVGDDVNPCSRTAPCKTFAGAISKTAAGGEINCIDPGGFGGVTITKSIAIICDDVEAGALVSATNGITINAAATDSVYLSGLDIHGTGTGIKGVRYVAGGAVHIQNSTIHKFQGASGAGISFAPSAAGNLIVSDSTILNNGNGATGGGIEIIPTGSGNSKVVLQNVQVEGNANAGIRIDMAGTTGGSVSVVMEGSHVVGGPAGITVNAAGAGSAQVMIVRTEIANNFGAALTASGLNATVRVSDSTIFGNSSGVTASNSATISSYGDNRLDGNPAVGAPSNGTFNGGVLPKK
jgi:hypothetical protein